MNVENIGRIVQAGDAEALMGAGSPLRAPEGKPGPEGAHSFSDILRNSVDQVNEYQHQADQAINELVAGRSKNIHETMLTIERADTSLKLMTQVRNKVLDAYKEIMRMQV